MLLSLPVALPAQPSNPGGSPVRYEPLDSWPYAYEDFISGVVRTRKGGTLEYDQLNVNIANGKLHYVEKGTIMQADMNNVYTVLVGAEVYINYMGTLYKVLDELEKGAYLSRVSVDVDRLNSTDIGYGVSSSTATSRRTTLTGLGIDSAGGNNMTDMSMSRAIEQKGSGSVLPLKTETYFYVYNILIPATRRDVLATPGVDPKAAKEFMKKNKVNWNKPLTQYPLIDFLYDQLDAYNKKNKQ